MGVHAPNESQSGNGFVLPIYLARSMAIIARAPFPATVIRPLLERFGFDGP